MALKSKETLNYHLSEDAEVVILNTKSLKYHCSKCEWAINFPRNCINISKIEAIKKGGMPCNVCGGSST